MRQGPGQSVHLGRVPSGRATYQHHWSRARTSGQERRRGRSGGGSGERQQQDSSSQVWKVQGRWDLGVQGPILDCLS